MINSSILQVKDNERIILISVIPGDRVTLSAYEDAPTATRNVGVISFTFDQLFEKIKKEGE